MPKEESKLSYRDVILISILSGGLAGISVDFALFPIDAIKTRVMASTKDVDYSDPNKSFFDYTGFVTSLCVSFPCAAMFWMAFEVMKFFLSNNMSFLGDSQRNVLAAATGECFQALVRTPSEVIKSNLQLGKYGGSTITAFKEILAAHGPSGFYKGYLSLIMREIPFSSIQYPFYEGLKMLFVGIAAKKQGIDKSKVVLGGFQLACIGSFAGSFSGMVVTPLDVLKTRQQTQTQEIGTLDLLMTIFNEAGFAGLFKGAHVRMMYMMVGGFVYFGIYEFINKTATKIVVGDQSKTAPESKKKK